MWANVGSMYNQDLDLTLMLLWSRKDFEWNMNYNLTTNMNKVTALDAVLMQKGTGIINHVGDDHEERSGFGYLFYG